MTKDEFIERWSKRSPSIWHQPAIRAELDAIIAAAQDVQRTAIRDHLTTPSVTWENDAELALVIESMPLVGWE